MAERGRYNTKQRQLVMACMAAHQDAFLTVDDVCDRLREGDRAVGRTTVYRTLEALAQEGTLSKVVSARGAAARYKLLPQAPEADASAQGQLCCLACGRAIPLSCEMLGSFATHVRRDHGFVIDGRRTVLYGYCQDCLAKDPSLAGADACPAGTCAHEVGACGESGDDARS